MLATEPIPGQPGLMRRRRLRKRACTACRFEGLPHQPPGLGAFPWELRDRRGTLRQNWHALRGQVLGRGVKPRQGFSQQLQKRIEHEYERFLKWDDNLSLDRIMAEATGTYEPELVEFETIYRGLSNQAADELKSRDEQPNFRVPDTITVTPRTDGPDFTKLALGGAAAAGIGWLLWRLSR